MLTGGSRMSQEQIQAQVMQAQGFAVEIEYILCHIFECERFGFGGQVNSDAIRKHPFLSMTQGLGYLYALYSEKRKDIDNFNDHFCFYSEMSLDELLSFDANEKNIDKCTIHIEKENGLEQVKYMISEFRKIVN